MSAADPDLRPDMLETHRIDRTIKESPWRH